MGGKKQTFIKYFLTLCVLYKRAQGEGCFQAVKLHIKMETSLGSFQTTERSTDNQEEEKPVPQRAPGDSGPQTVSAPQWSIPV